MPNKSKKPKLTGKQEKFAQLVAKGETQTDAYRKAFDVRPETLDSSQWVNASKLAADAKVSQRIEELRAGGVKILTDGIEDSAKTLVGLVKAEEEIIGVDGTLIGHKRNTDMNLRAAMAVLDRTGFSPGKPQTVVNNNFLIMGSDEVNDALSRLQDSDGD